MRQQEIAKGRGRRRSLGLKEIQGITAEQIEKLAAMGITDVERMLEAGRTEEAREELSRSSGVPLSEILELVKLADLARIVDIKSQHCDADKVESLSAPDLEELVESSLQELYACGWLVGSDRPPVTDAGSARLSRLMRRTRGERHRLSTGG